MVGVLFTFTAYVGGNTCTQECVDDAACESSIEVGYAGYVVDDADCIDYKCTDYCQKACCLGCKDTDGDSFIAKTIILVVILWNVVVVTQSVMVLVMIIMKI